MLPPDGEALARRLKTIRRAQAKAHAGVAVSLVVLIVGLSVDVRWPWLLASLLVWLFCMGYSLRLLWRYQLLLVDHSNALTAYFEHVKDQV